MKDVLQMDRAALLVRLGQMEAHAEWCEARPRRCCGTSDTRGVTRRLPGWRGRTLPGLRRILLGRRFDVGVRGREAPHCAVSVSGGSRSRTAFVSPKARGGEPCVVR